MKKPSLTPIVVTTVLATIGFAVMIPLLPLYARDFGAGGFFVGLLLALNQGVDFVFAPVAGRLSDRYGRRRPLLLALGWAALTYGVVALAPTQASLLLVWALAGFSSSQLMLSQAYIADITDEENRTRGMGWWGASFAIAFVIGPPLGALLYERSPVVAAFAGAFFALLAMLYALLFLRDEREHAEPSTNIQPDFSGSLKRFRAAVLGAIALYFLLVYAQSHLHTLLALFGEDELGWQVRQYGMYLGVMGLIAAVVQAALVGRLSSRFGHRPVILAGFLAAATGLLLLGASPLLPTILPSVLFVAVGVGLLMPSLPALLSLRVAPARKGQALGLFQSSSTLARVISPLVAGALYDVVSHSMPFYLAGGVALLGAMLTPVLLKKPGRPSPPD